MDPIANPPPVPNIRLNRGGPGILNSVYPIPYGRYMWLAPLFTSSEYVDTILYRIRIQQVNDKSVLDILDYAGNSYQFIPFNDFGSKPPVLDYYDFYVAKIRWGKVILTIGRGYPFITVSGRYESRLEEIFSTGVVKVYGPNVKVTRKGYVVSGGGETSFLLVPQTAPNVDGSYLSQFIDIMDKNASILPFDTTISYVEPILTVTRNKTGKSPLLTLLPKDKLPTTGVSFTGISLRIRGRTYDLISGTIYKYILNSNDEVLRNDEILTFKDRPDVVALNGTLYDSSTYSLKIFYRGIPYTPADILRQLSVYDGELSEPLRDRILLLIRDSYGIGVDRYFPQLRNYDLYLFEGEYISILKLGYALNDPSVTALGKFMEALNVTFAR